MKYRGQPSLAAPAELHAKIAEYQTAIAAPRAALQLLGS